MSPSIRHLGRLRKIANIMARHGYSFIVDQLGLSRFLFIRRGTGEPRLTRGEHLRQALEEMGTTFIKLGQVMSTRPDIIPSDIMLELQKLQDRVPSFSGDLVRKQVEFSLGMSPEEAFSFFDLVPLASASIGQVHRARTRDGVDVVVKVQRPGVRQEVDTDLEILFEIARLAQNRIALGKIYDFVELVEEFSQSLGRELDYSAEGRNADRMRKNLKDEPLVKIPGVLWDLSTSEVLTMEVVEGIKLTDIDALDNRGIDRHELASRLVALFLRQILLDGFFHADPHPGNLAVLSRGELALMDFGMVGQISEERRKQFNALVMGLVRRNSRLVAQAISDMGVLSSHSDIRAFRRDVEHLRRKYYDLPMGQIKLGKAVSEIMGLAFKHHIRVPGEFALLARTLVALEGVAQTVDPDLSILQVAEPIGLSLLQKQFSPREMLRSTAARFEEHWSTLFLLPRFLEGFLERLVQGEITLRIAEESLVSPLNRLDRIANRLSFSFVLLSFSIIMAGLMIASALGEAPVLPLINLPLLQLAGLAAAMMLAWLIFSILRSGRF